jgi:dTDP-4-dehydrorhamnose reductase
LFVDEFRSPIAAEVTARAVWELAHQNATGIFHIAGAERLSRWEIGSLIAERWPQLNPKLEAETLKNYSGAPRSPDTSLNSDKVQARLPFRLPALTEWLKANPGVEF